MEDPQRLVQALRDGLSSVLRGKPEVVELVLVAACAGGHVLVEDVPGVGKTTLAKALARAFAVRFSRVQFTPDLMPSDVTGSLVLDPSKGTFSFHKGPVFTNVLLADEINRASPRTQAALLEAMNEAQITVEGQTHPLEAPFFVIATQNPADYQGTYPLPEAQLDRFLLRVSVGYPSADDELQMLFSRQRRDPLDDLGAICGREDLLGLHASVRDIEVKPLVARYMLALVAATRAEADISVGVSPRGTLALFRASQARALMQGRDHVAPEDVQSVAEAALAHRVALRDDARYRGASDREIVARIVKTVPVPL